MHPIGFREITRIEIVTPHGGVLSTEFKAVVQAGLVKVRSGDAYSMEIGFDEEPAGQRRDFRPVLPLVFHW
jgi:hypothetical protein